MRGGGRGKTSFHSQFKIPETFFADFFNVCVSVCLCVCVCVSVCVYVCVYVFVISGCLKTTDRGGSIFRVGTNKIEIPLLIPIFFFILPLKILIKVVRYVDMWRYKILHLNFKVFFISLVARINTWVYERGKYIRENCF